MKVSSESGYDFALVGLLNNPNLTRTSNYTDRISGTAEKSISVNIPSAGTHYIEVGYAKDSSAASGQDCAWYSVTAGATWWMSKATVTCQNGQWLAGTWSVPVKFTGTDGGKGETGPAIVFRGDFSISTAYYGNPKRVDCVRYNGNYYVARTDAYTKMGTGTNPDTPFGGFVPTSVDYWNTFGAQFESIATNLLLAEMANIAGFIFKGNKLISQYGTLNSLDSTDFNNSNFIPNIILDGLRGGISLRGGIVDRYTIINSQNINTYLTTISGMSNTYQLNFSLSGIKVKFEYWESGKFIYLPNDEKLEGSEITFYNTSGLLLPVSGDINNKRYSEISNSSDLMATSSFVIPNKGFMKFRLYRLKASDYPGSYGTATNGYYFRWIIVDEKIL